MKVESKGSGGGFGYGRSSMMKLHEFLGKWEGGEEGVYLTTQDLDDDADADDDDDADEALPALMAAPLSDVMDCFPLRPQPAAAMIPSSYNVWVGASRAGSSSGLHHDFHDNMCVASSSCPGSLSCAAAAVFIANSTPNNLQLHSAQRRKAVHSLQPRPGASHAHARLYQVPFVHSSF